MDLLKPLVLLTGLIVRLKHAFVQGYHGCSNNRNLYRSHRRHHLPQCLMLDKLRPAFQQDGRPSDASGSLLNPSLEISL